MKKTGTKRIVIECKDEEDAQALFYSLCQYESITWQSNTEQAEILATDFENLQIYLDKSKYVPQTLKLV